MEAIARRAGHETSGADILQRIGGFLHRQADPGILAAYVFGSHAQGRAHRDSDVDVAVLLDRSIYATAKARFERRVSLTAEVMAVVGVNQIDVVILNDVPPLFARRILYTGVRVYAVATRCDHDFIRDTQLLAADLEPFVRRMAKRKAAALAR